MDSFMVMEVITRCGSPRKQALFSTFATETALRIVPREVFETRHGVSIAIHLVVKSLFQMCPVRKSSCPFSGRLGSQPHSVAVFLVRFFSHFRRLYHRCDAYLCSGWLGSYLGCSGIPSMARGPAIGGYRLDLFSRFGDMLCSSGISR